MCYAVRMNEVPKFDHEGILSDWRTDGSKRYLNFSGRRLNQLASAFAPAPEETRRMLLELRTEKGWAQEHLGAVLGAPAATIRAWESGKRTPSGPCQKLIWLVNRLFLAPASVGSDYDLATWGGKFGRVDPIIDQFTEPSSSDAAQEDYSI